jgi:hypothetical protein
MRINIWIRSKDIDNLAYVLSDNFNWDMEMKIDMWFSFPSGTYTGGHDGIIQVSITYEQFKKLKDL